MRARRLLLPLAALGLLLTSGCAGPDPDPVASGSAAAGEAFFASEEEAVEAALAVYADYAATADAIMADGGENPERLEPFVEPDLMNVQIESFSGVRERRLTGTGTTDFELHEAQQGPYLDREGTFYAAYLCLDLTEVDLIDENGNSVVAEDRLDLLPTEVAWTVDSLGTVRVSKDEPWLAENFC